MSKPLTRTVTSLSDLRFALDWAREMISRGLQRGPVTVTLGRPKRSLPQNDRFWAMMTDLAEQVDWYGEKLTKEEWRDVLTAAMKKQRAVPGLEGGFVVLGARTRDMSKEEMSALIDLAQHFGDSRGVEWKGQRE